MIFGKKFKISILTIRLFMGCVKCERVGIYFYDIMQRMKKGLLLILIVLLMSTNCVQAKHLHTEREYQTYWCNKKGGVMEYKLNDTTRVDCLLPTMAVEIDFAPKWHECIGQALYYGKKTRRTPACVLIMENPEKDLRFLYRLRYTVYDKKKIPEFKTFTIKPDEMEL